MESFSNWLEDLEKSDGQGIGDWTTKQFNVDDKNFADIGNVVLVNKTLKPDGSDKEMSYVRPTVFKLSRNKDGTAFRLTDEGDPSPENPDKAAFPHAASSPYHGKVYTLAKDEYEKLLQFTPQPQQAGPGF